MNIQTTVERWPLQGTFTISRGSKTEAEVVHVSLSADGYHGVGECVPYQRYGESSSSVVEQIDHYVKRHGGVLDQQTLQNDLKAGAARNAIDCALWDIRAKQNSKRVWELIGAPEPKPVTTAYTLSLDTAEAMAEQAKQNRQRPLLKIKLGPEGAIERIAAIRSEADQSRLIVDANEAWSLAELERAMPTLIDANVVLIEQPLAADQDQALEGFESPIPIAADESCHTSADLDVLVGRYDVINIKLDKAGGLTESLILENAAREAGLGIMVGCMMATSLAMAPATLLTTSASVVDLDGPLWLAKDRDNGLTYRDHQVFPPPATLWG